MIEFRPMQPTSVEAAGGGEGSEDGAGGAFDEMLSRSLGRGAVGKFAEARLEERAADNGDERLGAGPSAGSVTLTASGDASAAQAATGAAAFSARLRTHVTAAPPEVPEHAAEVATSSGPASDAEPTTGPTTRVWARLKAALPLTARAGSPPPPSEEAVRGGPGSPFVGAEQGAETAEPHEPHFVITLDTTPPNSRPIPMAQSLVFTPSGPATNLQADAIQLPAGPPLAHQPATVRPSMTQPPMPRPPMSRPPITPPSITQPSITQPLAIGSAPVPSTSVESVVLQPPVTEFTPPQAPTVEAASVGPQETTSIQPPTREPQPMQPPPVAPQLVQPPSVEPQTSGTSVPPVAVQDAAKANGQRVVQRVIPAPHQPIATRAEAVAAPAVTAPMRGVRPLVTKPAARVSRAPVGHEGQADASSAAVPAPIDLGQPVTHAPGPLAARILQIVELQAQLPPPRSMIVEIPEMNGLRLSVALRGAEVHVAALGDDRAANTFRPWLGELAAALDHRGLRLSFAGGGTAGQRRGDDEHQRTAEEPPPRFERRRAPDWFTDALRI